MMRVRIDHNTTPADARRRIEQMLQAVRSKYSHMLDDLDEQWQGGVLHFAFKAHGMKAHGTVEVLDREIVVDGKLPLLAKPFEGRIRSAIETEGRRIFASGFST